LLHPAVLVLFERPEEPAASDLNALVECLAL